MLKKRIIPILQYIDHTAVKTKKFENPRNVGNLLQFTKVFNIRKSDELAIINLSKKFKNMQFNYEYLKTISAECNMPLSIGGSINNLYEIEELLKIGCDKIILGEIFFNNKKLITEIIKTFGAQIIIAAVDINYDNNKYFLNYNKDEKYLDHIKMLQDENVGEIIITSVHKEGTMQGYDLNFIEKIEKSLITPILINGGAGKQEHFNKALGIEKIKGVCASSVFLFTELTQNILKRNMPHNIPIRF